MAERKGNHTRAFDSLVMPRLEINIPMPAGAGIPVQTPLRTPEPTPPAKLEQYAAGQSK
jgi:hypothetical protein